MSSEQDKPDDVKCDEVQTNSGSDNQPIPSEPDKSPSDKIPYNTDEPANAKPATTSSNVAFSSIFGFIENLATKLPAAQLNDSAGIELDSNGSPQIRRTSDLLETLQKALMNPPSAVQRSSIITPKPVPDAAALVSSAPITKLPVCVEIANAVNVTKMCVRINKKCSKTQRGNGKSEQFHSIQEQDSSTYVTFEAHGLTTGMIKSPDGMVYTTQVVERTSNPVWNKRFDVSLPIELLLMAHKRFILKVWRKSGTDSPQTRLTPTPFQDIIVGFVAVNISLLLSKPDGINDWFNVIDLFGRVNGRIKISVTPKESLDQFRSTPPEKTDKVTSALVSEKTHAPDVDLTADHNSVINQTLKRKFTELEDITKRLKARLVDVTDDADFENLEDEFDTDLNTQPDEAEDGKDNFDWMVAGVGGVDESKDQALAQKENEEIVVSAAVSSETLPSGPVETKVEGVATEVVISQALKETLIEETTSK